MKLYFSPGACSLSPHIALREAELAFDLVKVDLKTKKTESGDDYLQLNPNGYVPCLQLDDGRSITEGPAILQYVGDQAPDKNLVPPVTSFERYQLQQWLNFISTEIHKSSFSPLFNPMAGEEAKSLARMTLHNRLPSVAGHLDNNQYLLGPTFSVADIYLFVTLSWVNYVNIDLGPWPSLQAFAARVGARPAVQAAFRAEGLLNGD